jgi:uncharacterized lipoprotein YddW (UPF0748 family)
MSAIIRSSLPPRDPPRPQAFTCSFLRIGSSAARAMLLIGLMLSTSACSASAQVPDLHGPGAPPPTPREFRGAWVSTVNNGDWPSRPGLSVAEQKREMIAILDKAVSLRLNAIVFQVRPACDAMYSSTLEPWSEYLTGVQGQPPEPYYDPLQMWIDEAHRRGLELHAWFNPYRAKHASSKAALSPMHIARRMPGIVKSYGGYLWLDPGNPAAARYSLNVIMDVVRRYDIDGVHMDDYYYPYKVKDANKKVIDFPDDDSYARYKAAGGTLARDDWRRDNVNQFVAQMYAQIKKQKPWVRVGLSPFGIWRPQNPPGVKGLDSYDNLYCDSRLWFNKGWVDYLSPQLYWPIKGDQPFGALLNWWEQQNTFHRHLWPGIAVTRVGSPTETDADQKESPAPTAAAPSGSAPAAPKKGGWPAQEILDQINLTRQTPDSHGVLFWNMRKLSSAAGLDTALLTGPYTQPAIIPASPWLNSSKPATPSASAARGGKIILKPAGGRNDVAQWAIYTRHNGQWRFSAAPGWVREIRIDPSFGAADAAVISAIDRYGNESDRAALALK